MEQRAPWFGSVSLRCSGGRSLKGNVAERMSVSFAGFVERSSIEIKSVEYLWNATIRSLERDEFGSNQGRHCERSEAIQWMEGRSGGSGSPRRFAPRDDDFHPNASRYRARAVRGDTMRADLLEVRSRIRGFLARLRGDLLHRFSRMDIGEGCRISPRARLDRANPRGVHIGRHTDIAFKAEIMAY